MTSARVVFTDHPKDVEEEEGEEEEEEEEAAAEASKDSDHFAQEKPVFSRNAGHTRVRSPLQLCGVGGDKVPYTINRYLRDYQREGVRFIYNNYIHSRGCILGDDMGLGKTVQVIGFLAAVMHKTGTWEDIENNKPEFLQSQIPSNYRKPSKVFLVVSPLSVLYNWKDELDTWGHFQCVVVHGLRKEEELSRIKKGRVEIALTTYETLRLCLDQFNNIEWCAVFVDEAHKIKNPNSLITQAMKDLKCQIRIGLTGTILQNNLEELWCVMDWAVPGCLGSIGHFKNKFADPIEQSQRHSATKRALATGRKMVRVLVRKISPWFLRRTKALIKEQLPKKDDRVVYCSLTDFQQTVYQTVLDTEDVTLLLRSSEKCDCGSRRTRRSCCYKTNSEGAQMKSLYFSYLAILRKVSNHVALLQSTAGTSKKQEKYVRAICQKVFQKIPEFVQRCKDAAFEALSDPMYSGKMKVLQKLLKYYLQRRDKVLLFSLSTKLLDVLESYCMAEGLDYSRLDGATKAKERVQIVREFNRSTHINLCLVSTMAGGLGLNFVGANVVVLFDPTWNPANDLQAIDRAYRIGQCRDVTVLRLISLGTVEEVIYLRQVYKQQLESSVVGVESARRYFEAVQGHGLHKGELFGIKNLFRLQIQGTCLTHKILEREGQVEAGVMTTSTHTGEEEETKRDGEPPFTNADEPNREPIRENRHGPMGPRGVLDFSSGSEEDEEGQRVKRKASESSAADGTRSGNSETSPGRMNLLQHGFSRLLQRMEAKLELGEGDCSSEAEEVSSIRDTKGDLNKADNAVCYPQLGQKVTETGDGGRQERSDAMRKQPDQKARMYKEMIKDEESDGSSSPDKKKSKTLKTIDPRTRHFDGCSDESEDLEMEAVTEAFKGQAGCERRRQDAFVRDQARSKFTEDIEIFTSSEDEPSPVKKGRSRGGHLMTPQKDRSKIKLLKDGQTTASTERPTRISQTSSPASKGKDGTIDRVLGGVDEVLHTHSNQRVVGGSKAEELISRAAVRDVFKHKMYSQLPANHLLNPHESLPSSPLDSQPGPAPVTPEQLSVDHPVTFSSDSVHHTGNTTFIIGETPQAMRRQQLEEMATKFKFPSVHQFALEVLRCNSTQRLAWLQQYYTSLNHPELANMVTNYLQADLQQTSSSSSTKAVPHTAATKTNTLTKDPAQPKKRKYHQKHPEPQKKAEKMQIYDSVPQKKQNKPQNYVPEPQKKQTNPQKNAVEPLSDVPSPESEEQEETVHSARRHKRTKRGSVSSSGAFRAGGGLGVDWASSSGLGPGEAAAFLLHRVTDTPSCPDVSHGRLTTLSKPTAHGTEQEQKSSSRTNGAFQELNKNSASSTSSHSSLITDLLGDTSVLDDLLKPKSRGASPKTPPTSFSQSISTCLATPSPSRIAADADTGPATHSDSLSTKESHVPPTRKATPKGSRKDFWDILNEGNEESINKLTDLKEVERVCRNKNFAAKTLPAEEESKSLWKPNEKFLWKK
ncbi:DNA excision repair protein ERCC-6-like 2 [Aulostomus maculatus]